MPRREANASLEKETTLSQADTEPLSFEEDGEEEEIEASIANQLKNEEMADLGDEDAPGSVQGSPVDTSLNDVQADISMTTEADGQKAVDGTSADHFNNLEELDADVDADGDIDADAEGSEDTFGDSHVQFTTVGDDTGAAHSSQAGATFSDGSELTDESDEDEDAEGELEEEEEEEEEEEDDDDEMGGDDDDEDEDEEDEDADAEGDDEDEAVKGLAALTAAAEQESEYPDAGADSAATSGLDGLAVLAAAGAGDTEQLQTAESDSESATSSIKARRGRYSAKPRLGSRLNEVMLASEPTSDQDDDVNETEDLDEEEEGEDAAETGALKEDEEDESHQRSQQDNKPKVHSRQMSSLGHLATAAKRSATRPGAAAGLLAGAPSITIDESPSGAASVASSREGSVKPDEDEDEDSRVPGEDEEKSKNEEDEEQEDKDKDILDTPLLETEEAAAEEETSTDEAAVKRQEAMEALTKIEIGFAILRDKLYVERMDEISKEGEMILEGTHPDLIYLTNFIEARRERRLKLVEMMFEQQQKQYERVARTEEASTWNNWRNEVVELRKKQLDEISRKRRKLDREKRTLDGPRPARRHQIFETELVRNPDYDAAQAKVYGNGKNKRKGDPRQQELEDLEEMGAYVAYPDLRGADEGEAWMDMERMGIQTDARMMQGVGYYRMEEMGVDPYGNMYVMDGVGRPPVGGMEMMPPFAGGPPPNGMMMDRGGFDGRDRHLPPGYVLDGYGNPLPAHQFADGPPPGQRTGTARMPPEGSMVGMMPPNIATNQGVSSKKRAGTPSGGGRGPKQPGATDGRKGDGQGGKRGRSPGQGSAGGKKVQGSSNMPTTAGSHRAPLPPGPQQRNHEGMMHANKMMYGNGPPGAPRNMHDEGYYDGPLLPSHMGGGPPPSKLPPGAPGQYPPGGHMMGSPGQSVPSQLGPPPLPMGHHPMHGPPAGGPGGPNHAYMPNRNNDGIYPH